MLLRLIRLIRGYVTFKIIGRFPERFINLAIKRGIGIFDAEPKKDFITASMLVSDYKVIRPIARRCSVKLRIQSRRGLPFVTHKYRFRWGIAAGAAVCLIVSLLLQNFVWSVEINGINTLSETKFIAALREAGFYEGRFKGAIDLHKIERELLLEFKEIGWMSINLMGSHAEIEVKEKALVPEKAYSAEYCNIISSADGIILSENIKRGTSEVMVGSAVSKGQLLVSGTYENTLGELKFVDADAVVIASTEYTFTATCDEVISYYEPCDNGKRTSVSMFFADIPVTFSSEEMPFSSFVESNQVFLYDNPIPLVFRTEHLLHYEQKSEKINSKEAEKILSAEFALHKLFNMQKTKTITEEIDISVNKNVNYLTAKLICTEDIAVKENLVVNSD